MVSTSVINQKFKREREEEGGGCDEGWVGGGRSSEEV